MIIKSFTAESAAAALKRVRAEMGGEAIVLKTRQVGHDRGAARYEVTACLERPTVAQSSDLLPDRIEKAEATEPSRRLELRRGIEERETAESPTVTESPLRDRLVEMEQKLDRLLRHETAQEAEPTPLERERRRLAARLQDADFDDDFTTSLLGSVSIATDVAAFREAAERRLAARLAEHMLPQIMFRPGDRIAVVGPAGAGKSSLLGRLAAQLVTQQRQRITLLTMDNRKLGAFDELCNYAAVLDAEVADPFAEGARLKLKNDTIALIDTPGLTLEVESRETLRRQLAGMKPTHCVAVFSALTRTQDQVRLADAVRAFDPTHVAATMLDLTPRIGSVVAAAAGCGAKIALVSDASAALGLPGAPDPGKLAAQVVQPDEVPGE